MINDEDKKTMKKFGLIAVGFYLLTAAFSIGTIALVIWIAKSILQA